MFLLFNKFSQGYHDIISVPLKKLGVIISMCQIVFLAELFKRIKHCLKNPAAPLYSASPRFRQLNLIDSNYKTVLKSSRFLAFYYPRFHCH